MLPGSQKVVTRSDVPGGPGGLGEAGRDSVNGKKKVCLWCQRPGGLKTGALPYVGPLLYCSA